MELKKIKEQLQASKSFIYWNNEIVRQYNLKKAE